MREANSEFYFPSIYEHWTHIEMLENAISKLGLSINDINAKTIANKNILSDKKADKKAKNRARKEIRIAEFQIKDMTKSIEVVSKKD